MDKNDQDLLAKKIQRPVKIFAYLFGIVSAIIFGCGMSLVMTNLGTILGFRSPTIPGIVIGVAGLLLALINYPMYKGMLESRKEKYADRISELSETLTKRDN